MTQMCMISGCRSQMPSRQSLTVQTLHIALYWDDWIRKHRRAFVWLCLSEMQIFWAGQPNDDLKVEVLAVLATLQGNMGLITVNLNGLD